MLFWLLKILLFIPLSIVYPVRVIGRKNLPKKGRVMLCPNHQTLNDPIIVGLKFNRRFRIMGKSPLFEKKFNNWFLTKMGAYPVHTCSSDVVAVKKTLRFLNDEQAVCVFPEGARLKTDESNNLKHGVAMFALKTHTPIVPAFFVKKTMAFVPNTLLVGKPFMLSEMTEFKDQKIDRELLEKASLIIRGEIYKLKREWNAKKRKNKKNKKPIISAD